MNTHLELNGDRPNILETTLSATFSSSVNLKGQVAGANWLFLLPTLPLERVLCLGVPARATLTSLAALCQEAAVLCNRPQPVGEDSWRTALANVDWGPLNSQTLSQWPDASVDLVLLVDRQHAAQLGRQTWLQEHVQRLLKHDGLIHYAYSAPLDPLRGMYPDAQARFWSTPFYGEMSTIVPLHDQETIRYFTDRALYSPSLKVSLPLQHVARALRRRERAGPRRAGVSTDQAPQARNRPWAVAKSALRPTGSRLVKALDQIGTTIERNGLHRQLLHRTGVLLGCSAEALNMHPPQYLRTLAREGGIDIEDYAWGLAAPTDYNSRKLLFFLFDRTRSDEARSLRYIVKMVRHPDFNARLENERRALTWLHASKISDHSAIPRVVFAGYHANLALVGESAIEGVPFRSRTQGNADCTYLHQAIDWLTDLAGATASWGPSNAQAADALDRLLGQFLQFYRMEPEHRAFLADQINTIAKSSSPLPAVFQHGDPGLWNLLVTPSGQVAFLDWEAAETAGMPLWDFFHLMRSYGVHAARTRGVRAALQGIEQHLLADTPLRQVTAESIRCYQERVQLSSDLVQPLFYTCWMHRAIKEASRLPAARLEQGHYVNLLRLCIEQRYTLMSTLQHSG